MDGYLDETTNILNKWNKLLIQKNQVALRQIDKNWNRIEILKLLQTLKKNPQKYNALQEFFRYNFFIINKNNTELNISQYNTLALPIDSYRLVFINGKLSNILSDKNIDPWILTVQHDCHNQDTVHNNKIINTDIFSSFIESLSTEIIYINLPKKTVTEKPLYLLHINTGSTTKNTLITANHCCHLKIEHNAHAYIIEHFVSANKENGYFNGSRIFIDIEDYAQLNHVKLIFENNLSYHISRHDMNIGTYTNISSNIFSIFGPKFTCHKTNGKINHPKSFLSLNSLTFLFEKSFGNITTYLEHNNKSYSKSRQIHKIIACKNSTGIFNGLIKVNKGSIKTDGKMINNNLLLHPSASIYTDPKLEIYAEDVKCNHGATIGTINHDHLFYLLTRGISKKIALKILIYAFIIEITEIIKDSKLKEVILKKIDQAFEKSINDEILPDRKN